MCPACVPQRFFLASAAAYRGERILDDHSRFWLGCQQRSEGHFRNRGVGRIAGTPNRSSSSKLAMAGSIIRPASLAQTPSCPRVFLSPRCTVRRGSESTVSLARCSSRASILLTLGGKVGVGHQGCPPSKLPVASSAVDSPAISGALHFSRGVLTAFIC